MMIRAAQALDLDPLDLDDFYASGPPLVQRPADDAVHELQRITTVAFEAVHDSDEALAALRDIEFLLCRIERYEPGAHLKVRGLDQLLIKLGAIAHHMPRGDNHTYGVINPKSPRTRTYTNLASEKMLIEALRAGGVGIDTVLNGLATVATSNDPDQLVEAAKSLELAWHPMQDSVMHLMRTMPLEEFSHDIIPWFVPIEIGGHVYRAPTGAQFSNNLIDWLLWGVDEAEHNAVYRNYAHSFSAEAPEEHQEIVAKALAATGGKSLLTAMPRRLSIMDEVTGRAVLGGLDELLIGIMRFRTVHQHRLAQPTLAERESDYGSGGQNEDQLIPLLDHTRQARKTLQEARENWLA